jgi:uncharacterized surface protein with fasciclin (FAS1) repeats
MKKFSNILLALGTVALLGMAGPAAAHCGACGTDDSHGHDHSHMEKAKAQMSAHGDKLAIFPLAEQAGFKTLTAAVKAAGLDGVLTSDGPFTVFAPTDEAFAKLPAGTVESLLANPEQLKKVLLYHVVSGDVKAADVAKLDSAETLNGAKVAINTKGGVKVNDAHVIKADIGASNGTVHVIDTVLIPENL